MNKKILFIITLLVFGSMAVFAKGSKSNNSENAENQAVEAEADSGWASSIKYLAAALAVGIACLGGGTAVAKIGSAAMGAMSENAELSGKALPFVGLAEGICLWGFLVALFIIIM